MRSQPEEVDPPRARNLALQWLARREHSSVELYDKLAKKGCAPEIAAQVVERLKLERLLSDERYIENVIAARQRRGYGPLRVRQDLAQKGISKETIEQRLNTRGHEWIELVQQVHRKKFGKKPSKGYAARAKQARFLQNRGFTFEQIQRIFNARDID